MTQSRTHARWLESIDITTSVVLCPPIMLLSSPLQSHRRTSLRLKRGAFKYASAGSTASVARQVSQINPPPTYDYSLLKNCSSSELQIRICGIILVNSLLRSFVRLSFGVERFLHNVLTTVVLPIWFDGENRSSREWGVIRA